MQFILVTGDVTVTADNKTDVAFKNCAPFYTCNSEINDVFTDEANHIYIAMSMQNLIEYSNNTSRSLQQFKRDKVQNNNDNLTIDNPQSFKYKAALVGKTSDAGNNENSSVENTNITDPLKYFSN